VPFSGARCSLGRPGWLVGRRRCRDHGRYGDPEDLTALLATRLLSGQRSIDFISLPATRTIQHDQHRWLSGLISERGERELCFHGLTWVNGDSTFPVSNGKPVSNNHQMLGASKSTPFARDAVLTTITKARCAQLDFSFGIMNLAEKSEKAD
jgi:hypothetical protein